MVIIAGLKPQNKTNVDFSTNWLLANFLVGVSIFKIQGLMSGMCPYNYPLWQLPALVLR